MDSTPTSTDKINNLLRNCEESVFTIPSSQKYAKTSHKGLTVSKKKSIILRED